jgi:hypothetical protein
MGNRTNEKREEIIDMVEELFVMGYTRPYRIQKILRAKGESEKNLDLQNITFETIERYIDIVHRRIRNKYKNIDNNKVLKKELRDLEYMESQLWSAYKGSMASKDKASLMNTILKCKARRAKLLGLDTENLNINPPKTIEDLFDDYYARDKQPKQSGGVDDKQRLDSEAPKDSGQEGQ